MEMSMTDLTAKTIRSVRDHINGRNCGSSSNWSHLKDLLDEPDTYGTLSDWVNLCYGEHAIIRVPQTMQLRSDAEYGLEARRILNLNSWEWCDLKVLPVERIRERLAELLTRWDESKDGGNVNVGADTQVE